MRFMNACEGSTAPTPTALARRYLRDQQADRQSGGLLLLCDELGLEVMEFLASQDPSVNHRHQLV
jgi:hypothetical protein